MLLANRFYSMKSRFALLAGIAVCATLLSTGVAFAQSTPQANAQGPRGFGRMGHPPGIFGTVSAVSGSTLTVQSKGFGQQATAETYTVDASSATVMKDGSASTVSAVAVGDSVMVDGAVSGTSVVATAVRDGVPPGMPERRDMGMKGFASSTPLIEGNGQPVVGGSVSAISGSMLTVSAKAGATYSVDAGSATVIKGGATSSLANIAVGDSVVVQGAVNGTSITASSVIDQGVPKTANASSGAPQGGPRGFLGILGGFFERLFGFF